MASNAGFKIRHDGGKDLILLVLCGHTIYAQHKITIPFKNEYYHLNLVACHRSNTPQLFAF